MRGAPGAAGSADDGGSLVEHARRLARAGRLAEAASVLGGLLQSDAGDVAAHLLDVDLRLARRDAGGAERAAARAVALAPCAADAHAALGRALLAADRRRPAATALRRALDLDPSHAVAALLLNGVLQAEGRHEAAASVTAPFAALTDAPAALLVNHASALATLGRPEEAAASCSRAVAIQPRNADAVQLLASMLLTLGREAEGEAVLRKALAIGVDGVGLRMALGKALWDQGRGEEAEAVYREIADRAPFHAEAQRALANLIWMRTGDAAVARAPLDAAIAAYPGEEALHVMRAELLHSVGDAAGAYAALAHLAGCGGLALRLTAARLALPIDPAFAERQALSLVASSPSAAAPLAVLGEAQLALGKAADAAATAHRLVCAAPTDQLALALQATAWRLQGDERERSLNDYGALVRSYTLAPPPGWPDLPAFLGDVALALERLHVATAHPIGQSVRGGAQTTRDLLRVDDPAIRALFQAFDGPVRAYIADLGQGDDPLRRRAAGDYAFSGAWSVRLRSGGGRHANHVHPDGWISSAFYVRLPSGVGDADDGREGWLTFGEPGTPTSPPLGAAHAVAPRTGRLVLFPSYLWHGTLPFCGEGERLTVAFDIVPKPASSSRYEPVPLR